MDKWRVSEKKERKCLIAGQLQKSDISIYPKATLAMGNYEAENQLP